MEHFRPVFGWMQLLRYLSSGSTLPVGYELGTLAGVVVVTLEIGFFRGDDGGGGEGGCDCGGDGGGGGEGSRGGGFVDSGSLYVFSRAESGSFLSDFRLFKRCFFMSLYLMYSCSFSSGIVF